MAANRWDEPRSYFFMNPLQSPGSWSNRGSPTIARFARPALLGRQGDHPARFPRRVSPRRETHGVPDRDSDPGAPERPAPCTTTRREPRRPSCPSYGFNLFDLRLPAAGEVRPMISAPEDFAENPRGGAGHGTPILFPYPNRVGGARFTLPGDGRTSCPANNGPNAIHGFAVDAPWDVVEHKAGADAASIVGRYQISRNTPADAGKLAHRRGLAGAATPLAGRRLTMTITVSNPTASDLPYGFGIHPVLPAARSPRGRPRRTRVIVPAVAYLGAQGFLPTGETRPVDARLDFRPGQPMPRPEARRRAHRPGVRRYPRRLPARRRGKRGRIPPRLRPDLPRAGALHPPRPPAGHLAGTLYPDDRRDQPPGPRRRRRLARPRARAQETMELTMETVG